MHFTSFDIITYIEFISIYLYLQHGQCFYIITPMMKLFYAGIKQPLAVGQTRLRVSLCLKKDTQELYDGTLECWNHSEDISNLYF